MSGNRINQNMVSAQQINDRMNFLLELDAPFLREWYLDAVEGEDSINLFLKNEEEEKHYVVFVVRRGAALAVLLEQATGVRMKDRTDKRFLTDAGLILQTSNLVKFYRNHGRFPRITILDELMVRGGNLCHFLEVLEAHLREQMTDLSAEKIHFELVNAVKIRVFAGLEDSHLLLGDYSLSVKVNHFCGIDRWRELSSRLSSLLLDCNVANAGYIFSSYITEGQIENLRDSGYLTGFVRTVYQNVPEYTYVDVIGNESVKAILSLRLIEGKEAGCRAIPFVFLPDLSQMETDRLWEAVLSKAERKLNAEIGLRAWTVRLREIRGLRSANEFLTLLLSVPVLQDFQISCGIQRSKEDHERELQKMVRNYNMTSEEETENILRLVLDHPLLTLEEVKAVLTDVIGNEMHLILRESADTSADIPKELLDQYRLKLEDRFYEMNLKEESETFKKLEKYRNGEWNNRQKARRYAESSYEILQEILNDKVQNLRVPLTDIIACIVMFLQMMDAGVVSVSSYAPQNRLPEGMAQFAKAGEQSQMLMVLRYYEYLPLLRDIQRAAGNLGKSMSSVLTAYGKSKEFCDLDSDTDVVEQLQKLLKQMAKAGQKPSDWSSKYLDKYDFGPQKDIQYLYDFIQKQMDHMESFQEYMRNR